MMIGCPARRIVGKRGQVGIHTSEETRRAVHHPAL
jgi:hypothetical protein